MAVQLYHHRGEEMRHNASLRVIFGEEDFFKGSIKIKMDYTTSLRPFKISCIGYKDITVLDNEGHKVSIAPNINMDIFLSRRRAFVS